MRDIISVCIAAFGCVDAIVVTGRHGCPMSSRLRRTRFLFLFFFLSFQKSLDGRILGWLQYLCAHAVVSSIPRFLDDAFLAPFIPHRALSTRNARLSQVNSLSATVLEVSLCAWQEETQ